MKTNTFLALFLIGSMQAAAADGLKVFGPEFCSPYDGGACINFPEGLQDSKTWTGSYKYAKGRKAYKQCVKENNTATDADFAFCSMVFHREEQSPQAQSRMCDRAVRNEYHKVSNDYMLRLYDVVWKCSAAPATRP